MSFKLSEGALAVILAGGNVDDPVMQILGHKRIAGTSSSTGLDRFRLLVSDGKHLNSFAMLATQLNDKVTSGELCDFTVVQITRYITSMVSNADKGDKRVMVILDVKVLALGSEVGFKIGNPKPITEGAESESNGPRAAPVPRQIQQKPVPSLPTNNVSVMSSPGGSSLHTHPISSLSPYQNKWVIKVRVISKSPIRTWSNARGEGKLFSMDLVDESGEIRATAFKDQCDKFYDMIEENKVYLISKCSLKTANKKFTNIKNDYEMSFTNDTQVIPCNEDCGDIPSLTFNFIQINKLADLETNSVVDVIGVCKSTGDMQTLIARTTNRELKKREVTIVDESNSAVSLTLWGQQAEEFDGSLQPVLAVKNGRINEYAGGKSVSLMQSSGFQINPDIKEAHRLRGWFDNVGVSQEQQSISARTAGAGGSSSNWITLQEALDNHLGSGDKADYFSSAATIMIIRSENSLYKACPTAECNKKVIDQNNGMYRCEKCNREYPNFKYRLLLLASLGDYTGHQWVTCFQDVGETLLGMTAQEVGDLLHEQEQYQSVFQEAAFKTYLFRLRAKMENYNDENRLKVTVMEAKPLPLKDYNARLIAEIKEIAGVGSSSS